jgi:predicted molibdopterin-dependent oxidoreductase YjgC
MAEILTTCVYCGCGCGLYLRVENGRVTGTMPSRNHPVSQGNLCVKGWHIHEFIHSPRRLTRPLVRKNGELAEVDWDEALDFTAESLARLREKHGPDSIGLLSSAKCSNEENFLLQKFSRAVLGTNNIDHCARL